MVHDSVTTDFKSDPAGLSDGVAEWYLSVQPKEGKELINPSSQESQCWAYRLGLPDLT